MRDSVLHSLVPVLRGRPVHDIEGAWADMYQEALLIGRRGAVLRSMSAIDIALFDLVSRKAGLPLAKFLGGWKDKVPAYASGGYYREGDPFEQLERGDPRQPGAGLHRPQDQGRWPLGRARTPRACKLARELVGPEGRLSLDANNAYRHAAEAIEAGRAFERAAGAAAACGGSRSRCRRRTWPGHARVAAALDTAVATGEIHQTRWDFRALIEQRAAAIIQADAAVVGGISEWRRIAALCASFDVPMAPHWHHNLHVHLAASHAQLHGGRALRPGQGRVQLRAAADPGSREHGRGRLAVGAGPPGSGRRVRSTAVDAFTLP